MEKGILKPSKFPFRNYDMLERMYQSLPEDTGSAGTIMSTGAGASSHADNIKAPKSATTAIFTLFILNPYSLFSAHIVPSFHITQRSLIPKRKVHFLNKKLLVSQ